MQRLTSDLQDRLQDTQRTGLLLSFLESSRGFLVHLQQVYPALTPYLKGLYLTIDSWRGNRDEDGWRVQSRPNHDFYPDGQWNGTLCAWEKATQPTNRPQFVRPVTRYSDDLQALMKLLEAEDPPLRFVRQNKVHTALYGFVDASSSGFGSSFATPSGTYYSYGIWGKDHEGDSSNYRELNNLVQLLKPC
jgi:hypothetical protein